MKFREEAMAPLVKKQVTWKQPPGGGLESADGRWRIARTTIHSTWTLTDRQSGYRRHFPTAPDAMRWVAEDAPR